MGFTFVRRKWSGQLVPSEASCFSFADSQNSKTSTLSVKWPTIGLSVDAIPRNSGASSAARARRFAFGKAANLATRDPKGLALPFSLMNFSAVLIISREFFSHSLDDLPQAVIP